MTHPGDESLKKIGDKIKIRNEKIRKETVVAILQDDKAVMRLLVQKKIAQYDQYMVGCGITSFLSFTGHGSHHFGRI